MLNSLNEANYSKFVTRNWNIFNDNSKENYDLTNEITYYTGVLKSKFFVNKVYLVILLSHQLLKHR